MAYHGQNILVIESKFKDGCRVLLNGEDLLTLQNIEWSIFEAVVRKFNIIRPMILHQVDQMSTHM